MLRDRLAKLAAPQCERPAFLSPLFTGLSVRVSCASGRVDETAAQPETGRNLDGGRTQSLSKHGESRTRRSRGRSERRPSIVPE